jgi:alpha-L-arabinofuranosidase
MKLHHTRLIIILILNLLTSASLRAARQADIHVYVDQPTVQLSPRLYGLFYEDINYAADGGLYAELLQNRSFEYYALDRREALSDRTSGQLHPLYAWTKVERGGGKCDIRIERTVPLNRNNQNYVAVYIDQPGTGVGIQNLGYEGIPVDKDECYDVSLYAACLGGKRNDPLVIALESENGEVYGSTTIPSLSDDWKRYQAVIRVNQSDDQARLTVTTTRKGKLYLDVVSLFPRKTFRGRKNGLRPDLAQTLADLKPTFFRFPGGCIAHGCSLQNAYRWKDSVGDVAQRRPNWNRWGYHQTYGLGYYEYFLLCEDIGATPLPVLPVGVSCGFNKPYQCVPMDDLQEWIDDALDLIEFANGSARSQWGKVRAGMGHVEPFGLEYICLGNEEHDTPACRERVPYFVKAIRQAYPEIKIIGTSGLGPGIPLYGQMKALKVYSSDEHYYNSPEWYIQNQNRFDHFDRNGPKIFVGEYASRANTLFNAVAEAAYLTGIERNGDMVDMACYAPLLAHVHHTQWTAANLIWFDKRAVVKTPNYYVQQLFSCNKGDVYLQNKVVERTAVKQRPTIKGAIGIGSWNTTIALDSAMVNGSSLAVNDWRVRRGDFRVQADLYQQLDVTQTPALSVSTVSFQDNVVTYRARAKKTGGSEGFLVVFGYQDSDNYYWWNVGGWSNTQHGIERLKNGHKSLLIQKGGRIQSDTWYDLKVELHPDHCIRCYLDNQLVFDHREHDEEFGISVSATRDNNTNELMLKLVNPAEHGVEAAVKLEGVSGVSLSAQVTVLSGDKHAKNTIEDLNRIVPVTRVLKVNKEFTYRIPAMSVQVIRMGIHQ